eukprot:2891209-Amphidinium_carterae.1
MSRPFLPTLGEVLHQAGQLHSYGGGANPPSCVDMCAFGLEGASDNLLNLIGNLWLESKVEKDAVVYSVLLSGVFQRSAPTSDDEQTSAANSEDDVTCSTGEDFGVRNRDLGDTRAADLHNQAQTGLQLEAWTSPIIDDETWISDVCSLEPSTKGATLGNTPVGTMREDEETIRGAVLD